MAKKRVAPPSHAVEPAARTAPVSAQPGRSTEAGDGLRQLQRRVGNRTVLALLSAQAKLEVGRADDPLEEEADAVASWVVRELRTEAKGRQVPDTALVSAGQERHLGRTLGHRPPAAVGPEGGEVGAEIERAIVSGSGGGRALPLAIRGRMEGAFGSDFGSVRVHAGPTAKDLNEQLGAQAFTRGRDIFFRDGMPNTTSSEGLQLLAHELTHTVQQGSATARQVDLPISRRH